MTAFQPQTFTTSRQLDFASERELVAQIGHPRAEWPLVILKELLDNALDGCEDAGIAPVIHIRIDERDIAVQDNGPGISQSTIERVLDYSVRVSSREAYVAPTRGAQGNALKTVIAMPFVLGGNGVEIASQGQRHSIKFQVDHVQQKPVVDRITVADPNCKNGALFEIRWPPSASSILTNAKGGILQIASDFTWLNPSLSLTLDWFGETLIDHTATDPDWPKWKPSDPAPAHWYNLERFQRRIAAYVSSGRPCTVREFVSEFSGLSGSTKGAAVLAATGLQRAQLSDLLDDKGFDGKRTSDLLRAMQDYSKPVPPAALGALGREHFEACCEAEGCEMDSFAYKKIAGEDSNGIPCIIEAAFAWRGQVDDSVKRRLISGVNWSPGIRNPFRNIGGESLDDILGEQECDADYPIIIVLHVAYPTVTHTDRGKSAVTGAVFESSSVGDAVESVTKRWAKQIKREIRDENAQFRRRQALTRSTKVSVKGAAWQVMEKAYLAASTDNTLPAEARQIMYAARGDILRLTGNEALDDNYFTQTLLPDYVEAHPNETADWNVVYNARGHFREPHTDHEIGIGTLEVREYLDAIEHHRTPKLDLKVIDLRFPTHGPKNRFGGIFYIEKEGFIPLLEAVQLTERYDLAVASNKGMSVTAARTLVERLCDVFGIPLLVLHDFDKSGFSIKSTLHQDTRRYTFKHEIEVIDLGLRMDDIKGLESEPVTYGKASYEAVTANLRANGATNAEIEFLVERDTEPVRGKRVEINAFTSGNLVRFIEGKLAAHKIHKVVPDKATLEKAVLRVRTLTLANAEIDVVLKRAQKVAHAMPPVPHLERKTRQLLKDEPTLSWDAAVARLLKVQDTSLLD